MIDTETHYIKDAIRFKNSNGTSTWAVLGNPVPWTNELIPPTPLITMTELDSPICAIKASVYWVVADDSGTFIFNDINGNAIKYLSFADEASAIAGGCNLVLMTANTLGTGISVASFREVGFATDLVPASGYETATVLQAANISSWGDLETVQFMVEREVTPSTLYTVTAVMQYGD